MSALPLFWSEADPTVALSQGDERAPVIRELAETFTVTPIDLADDQTLQRFHLLMLAQPSALSGAELVAIDGWVRAGGRVLVFADPVLTWPSRFALGDPRAAPAVTLLDPLLTRWGLQLVAPPRPAEQGRDDVDDVDLAGGIVAVSAAGAWRSATKACEVVNGGLRATCRIGEGRAELVADADVLDLETLGDGGTGNANVIASLLKNLSAGLPVTSINAQESKLEQGKNKEKQHRRRETEFR